MPLRDLVNVGAALEWWEARKRFEKIMLILTLLALLILIIVSASHKSTSEARIRICNTPVCLDEAARLKKSMQPSANPCENIYQFSCGNFDKKVDADERMILDDFRKQQLKEIATETPIETDHKTVKLAKKIYQACINDIKIEEDQLTPIKTVLKDLGGWPVLEGEKWNPGNFSWVDTVYKIREMGYFDAIFFYIKIEHDPEIDNSMILQMSTAGVYNYQFNYYSWNVTDVATTIMELFGGVREQIKMDVAEMFEFVEKLQTIELPYYHFDAHKRLTIAEYQTKVGYIDWMEYINRIIGPGVQLNKDSSLLFAPPETMVDWLQVLMTTPKRVLANYMLWKVVSEAVPYLHCEIRVGLTLTRNEIPRDEFCMKEATQRFFQNPFNVMAARRYLPRKKRDQVRELLNNMKLEFISILKKADWMDGQDKEKAIQRMESLKLWIGMPINYFDDKILDNFVFDWIENKHNETFLSLIAQADRSYKSMIYTQITVPLNVSHMYRQFNDFAIPAYIRDMHTFYVPFTAAQKMLFNGKRPNYLNYGAMGSLVGYRFVRIVTSLKENWSVKTKKAFETKIECMEKAMNDFLEKMDEIKWESSQTLFLAQKTAAAELSYAAYKKWSKQTGKESLLVGTNYTADQLFWISSAMAWCKPYLPIESWKVASEDRNYLIKLLGVSTGNHLSFADNFNCHLGSRMKPTTRCKIF